MSDPSPAGANAWTRSAFAPGGGDAFVFFAVYASEHVSPTLAVSEERHRTRGLPDGMLLVLNARDSAGYTPADFAVGASDAAYAAADAATLQFVIAGIVPDPTDLLYLRDAVGVVASLIDAGATAVFDLQTLTLFTAEEFMQEVFAADAPDGDVHVAVFATVDDETETLFVHTRGMRKFGRPDVSLRDLPPSTKESAGEVVHALVEALVRGARVEDGRLIAAEGFPRGLVCHLEGALDDPYFNNVRLELREPSNAI